MNVTASAIDVPAVTVRQMLQLNADAGSFDLNMSNFKEKLQLHVI